MRWILGAPVAFATFLMGAHEIYKVLTVSGRLHGKIFSCHALVGKLPSEYTSSRSAGSG